jgi:hypothetical protein
VKNLLKTSIDFLCCIFRVFTAIIYSAVYLGRESQYAPDYGKAKMAAGRVLACLTQKPVIDNYSTEGLKPVSHNYLTP